MIMVRIENELRAVSVISPYAKYVELHLDDQARCCAFTDKRNLALHLFSHYRDRYCEGDAQCKAMLKDYHHLLVDGRVDQKNVSLWLEAMRTDPLLNAGVVEIKSDHPLLSSFRWAWIKE